MSEDPRLALAKAVLTRVQLETWIFAEAGHTHRQIARWRNVSKATVTDCLETCDRKLEEATREADQDTAGSAAGRAGADG